MSELDYPTDKEVTLLKGSWPQWYGNYGMQFVYVRIRHGECQIGVGNSHSEAESNAEVVAHDSEWEGVTEIHDAIGALRAQGFKVKSYIIPEHVVEFVGCDRRTRRYEPT